MYERFKNIYNTYTLLIFTYFTNKVGIPIKICIYFTTDYIILAAISIYLCNV